jgi:membrane fusion protein (multidrug efflux system)
MSPFLSREHPPAWTRRRAVPAFACGILLALLASILGCGGGSKTKGRGDFPVPVELATAHPEDIRDVLALVGTLQANESVLLKPEIEGQIASILFKEGQKVSAGELLVQLDDRETAASLQEAQADLSYARAEYGRRQNLFAQRVVSKQELDRARSDMERLAAHVELMKARLAKTRITAPFAGIVGARRVSPGDVVKSGDDLANLEEIDPLKLEFDVPERYLPRIAVGQTVDLKVTAFPDRKFKGEVYFIDPRVSESNRSVKVKAHVPNHDSSLRPGMYANVELLIQEKKDAITIPEQALVPQGDKQFVFRVKPDSTVELVPVETGIRHEGIVEVAAGLSSGDRIVSAGQQKIGPGSKVVPFGTPPPGAPPTAKEPPGKAPGEKS